MRQFNCALLVDDDGVTNFVHQKIISQLELSHQIHAEYNGEKALNFLHYFAEQNKNCGPELILLDLKMPVLDGYEFLEYLWRKNFSNKDRIKVIVLTNSQRPEELEKLKKFNVTYLNKPLTIESLKNLVSLKQD